MRITSCTILSRVEGMPSFLILPLGLGIYVSRTGLNWNCSVRISCVIVVMASREKPSMVAPSVPGVIFPGADAHPFVRYDVQILFVHQTVDFFVHPSFVYIQMP
jgi:hypothetical protein